MKNKFLKITGLVVIFVALVGFWGYNKYFKADPEIQQQLNNQFGEGFFSFDEKTTENLESNNGSKSVDEFNNKGDSPANLSKEQEEGKTGTTSPPVNENTTTKKITQDEINANYTPRFKHLQSVALSRLDALYSAAIQEYVQQKNAGTLNRSALAQKYIQAGTRLEASLDSQFYGTLNEMQAELVANNLPTDSVGVIKSEYENAKSGKRSQLLAKIGK